MAEYYDQEMADKCAKISTLHDTFYTDLKEKKANADQAYVDYQSHQQSLSSQYSTKVSDHIGKF